MTQVAFIRWGFFLLLITYFFLQNYKPAMSLYQVEMNGTADASSKPVQNRQPKLSLPFAMKKLSDSVRSLEALDPSHAGYVSQGAAACILLAVHNIDELKARGPQWDKGQVFVPRIDGMKMNLQRQKPWFEAGSGRRSRSKAKRGLSDFTDEVLSDSVNDPSCPPPVVPMAYENPALPFVPNGSQKKPKSLINRLKKAAATEANKENTGPRRTEGSHLNNIGPFETAVSQQSAQRFGVTQSVPPIPLGYAQQSLVSAGQPMVFPILHPYSFPPTTECAESNKVGPCETAVPHQTVQMVGVTQSVSDVPFCNVRLPVVFHPNPMSIPNSFPHQHFGLWCNPWTS